jgi:hypothetical protein
MIANGCVGYAQYPEYYLPDRAVPRATAADERQILEAWLDFHRETLLGKCGGLTVDQLRRALSSRPALESWTTPSSTRGVALPIRWSN